MTYWALRREKICASPSICPHSEDGEAHGPECDVTRIEKLIAESAAGELLLRVEDIDFALKAGFTVTLGDVTAEEFAALRVVRMERDRWQQERQRENGAQHIQGPNH